MNSRILKIVSLFLTIVLLVNMLPLNVLAEDISSNESVAITSEPQIVDEIVAKRTKYTKEYLLDNGLFVAAVYNEPVHFQKDGQWKEIDNTLVAKTNGTYTNTAGVWEVQFPQKLSQSNAVSITKDGYTVSFAMAGELRNQGNLEIASMEDSLSTSSAPLETASITVGETVETFSVSSAQLSTAQLQSIDSTEAKKAAQYADTVLDKNTSRLTYSNVYSNTDVRYDLQANRVKESVILESYDNNLRGYRYTLNVGELIPVLNDDGTILFFDKDRENVVMAMPAPFLIDKNFVESYDVHVSLTGKDGVYTLIYLLPQQWLSAEDRAWPVILDPVIFAELTDNNIQDTTVISARKSEAKYMRGTLQIGYSSADKISRVYLGFTNLPPISSSDVIVSATMSLNKVSNSTNSIPAVVHKVDSTWNVETLCWNNKPSYDPTIEDYQVVKKSGRYYWDVTDIARYWYENANTGMLIKASDAVETGKDTNSWKEFYSCNYADDPTDPWLYITFRNNNGLESYWDYTSSSAGRAGTGYVNNYTGNMVWTRSDIGFGGNRMPVSISHFYNLNDADNNIFGMGYGWRTNYNQRVYKWSEDSNYFIWEDSDGTEHYFYKESTNIYKDEDGLELTLKNNGTGTRLVSITDKQGNASYFDTRGRLTFMENNQPTESSIFVTYTTTSGLLIDTIEDGAGRVYDFTYSGSMLSKIDYLGSGSTPISSVNYTYSSSNLTKITDADGKESNYTYSGHILKTAQDVDGYKLQYTYNTPDTSFQPYRVTQVKELFVRKEDNVTIEGGELNFEYAHNQTTLTDHNGNKQIIQFNNFGNTISIQDGEGRAQYAQYTVNDPSETGKANQLRLSSKMQNTVNNLLQDHSFESSTLWTAVSGTRAISSAQKYLGNKSLSLTNAAEVASASFTVPAGETYTFSAYLKTSGTTAVLKITDGTSIVSSQSVSSADWTRSEVSFTNNGTSAVSVTARVASSGTGTTYVDCVQMEKAPTASRYNLVQNSDFQSSTGWSSNSGREAVEGVSAAAPQLNDTVYYIKGAETKAKRVTQTVTVSGLAGDTFVVSGWGKGDSVPLPKAKDGENQRQFAVIGVFNYTDGTKSDEFIAQFNPDTDSSVNWQFSSQMMVAKKAYSSIVVSIAYDYNLNIAYFDGVQLFKEEFGNSYTYDNDGNVISITDTEKQATQYTYKEGTHDIETATLPTGITYTYTYYDGTHNVKTCTSSDGQKKTYTYDSFGNVLTETTTYTGTLPTNGTSSTTTYVYTTDGNRLVSATDTTGNTTIYSYNEQTNLLEYVQYEGDTTDNPDTEAREGTATYYTYDDIYRLDTVSAIASDNPNNTEGKAPLMADYEYNEKDQLAQIKTGSTDNTDNTGGTEYNFFYGDFSLRTSVKVGENELASYEYTTDRNKYLQALVYGNGDSVEYTYDDYGRLLQQTYEDGATVTYKYDNDGALATVIDSETGVTTKYYYDFTGRSGATELRKNADLVFRISVAYDQYNRLSKSGWEFAEESFFNSYTYNPNSTVGSMVISRVDEDGTEEALATLNYGYDGLYRMTSLNAGEDSPANRAYTYRTVNVQVDGQTIVQATGQINKLEYSNVAVPEGVTTFDFEYSYDDRGNISSYSSPDEEVTYTYDSQNQLLRADNVNGTDYTYTYDDAGNLLQVTKGGAEYSYEYTNSNWGDLLTKYHELAITYDDIGNPLSYYNGWNFTWKHGRQMATASNGTKNLSFTYDADGLRTSKTVDSVVHNYYYADGKLLRETYGNTTLDFIYDASGIPFMLRVNGTPYYYITNVQGDVIRLTDANGAIVASYQYDPYGDIISATGTLAETNPLRYRGYYYDDDTELYYLQSRYYDPNIGRLINADAFISTGQGLIGNNMFTYCLNNPVILTDYTGACCYIAPISYWYDCCKSDCPNSKYFIQNETIRKVTQVTESVIRNFNAEAAIGLGFCGDVNILGFNLELIMRYDLINVGYSSGEFYYNQEYFEGIDVTFFVLLDYEFHSIHEKRESWLTHVGPWEEDTSNDIWTFASAGLYIAGGGRYHIGLDVVALVEDLRQIL